MINGVTKIVMTKADVLDWKNKQDTVYTPQAEFGDLTGLATLPEVKLGLLPGAGGTQRQGRRPSREGAPCR